MRNWRTTGVAAALVAGVGATLVARAEPDWSRFRGPNGSGISTAHDIPTEFDAKKNLIWRLPLPNGHSSPILLGNRIYLTAYRENTLYTMAIDRANGRILWERSAPEVKTKIVDKRNNPASPSPAVEKNGVYVFFPDYGLMAYDESGRERWKMPLGPFNNIYGMGASPVIVGDLVILACDQSLGSYLLAVNKRRLRRSVNDPGNKVTVPPADDVWKTADADKNGVITKPEFPKYTAAFWFDVADLDTNGSLTPDEWAYYRAALDSENGMLAIRLGGSGDMSDKAIRWKYQRSVPQLPSPLLYGGVLYMVNDNGIITTLNPDTGAVIKQGRLTGALGPHFASPTAADGHIFFTSEAGAIVVVAPGGDLTPQVINNLGEDTYATPAFADGRIYVRTTAALYAFGKR